MLYAGNDLSGVMGQIIIGGFFIFQGVRNAMYPKMVLNMFEANGYSSPRVLLWCGLAMIFIGGTLVILDLATTIGASILLIFTILATAIFHRWWKVNDPARRPYVFLFFFYNVCVIGALLLLI